MSPVRAACFLSLAAAAAAGGCGDNLPPTHGTRAPSIEILSPSTNAVLGTAAVAVRVRITDDGALASATLATGATTVAIDPAALDAAGEATVTLTLADGAHAISLVAVDGDGFEARAELPITVDLAGPAVALAAPRRGAAETRRLLFAQLSDAAGITAIAYTVNGGAPITVAVSGAPTAVTVREALPLRAGANTLALSVTDRFGHVRTETIDFRYGLTTTAGGAHSGAIVGDGLHTWGRYNVGQLGLGGAIGDAASRLAPELVPAFGAEATAVAAIAFNQNTSLAVRSDGTVWTWGANGDGQLGQGDLVQRTVPGQVTALSGIVYGVLGYSHGLALRADGAVLAWGKNASGQAGVDSADDQLVPVVVGGLPEGIVELAAGSEHSLALAADGRVFVWGRNTYGNLGGGTADDARHAVPAAVPGLTDVIDLATGRDHVLALRADGSVVAWGLGASGQLGYGVNADPAGEDRAAPVVVAGDAAGMPLTGVRAVYANGNTSYAIAGAGEHDEYWGWGQNFSGQLALGATSPEEWFARRSVVYTPGQTPVYLDELVSFTSIGTGATHTVARTATGELFAWGWNFRGSLGVPAIANAWAQTVAVEVGLAE